MCGGAAAWTKCIRRFDAALARCALIFSDGDVHSSSENDEMPITRSELVSLCKSLGLNPSVPEGDDSELGLFFETQSFVNREGENAALIICRTLYNGEYVAAVAPDALNTTECKYKGALFAAMAEIGLRTKYVQLVHDPSDGEIRLEVEVPVVDGTLTANQLEVMIYSVLGNLETFYPVLKHAMETGKIDFSRSWNPPEPS